VLREIDEFWTVAEDYRRLGLLHHRGLLLEGPPGTGKTSALHQAAALIVGRGDVVFFGEDISTVAEGLRAFRDVEPERRVVVMFEDMDEHLGYEQHALLQLLDGEATIDGVCYLATTNFVERFPARLLRPGRFDRIVHIGPPSYEGRLAYLTHKIGKIETAPEIARLAKATAGLTFAHLRELVLAVYALKEPVADVIHRLGGQVTQTAEREQRAVQFTARLAVENRGGFDETATSFRYRVREPSDFQPDSMRTITLKEDAPKIQAVVGRLKGETTTAIQSVIFPKDEGWTQAEAQAWVEAHAEELRGMHPHEDEDKGVPVHTDPEASSGAAGRNVEAEEDGENVYLTLTPLDLYEPDTLRDIEIQGGEKPVVATIGVLRDDADQGDLAKPRITVLTFPKAAGWTRADAEAWLGTVDLEHLLADALGQETGEPEHEPMMDAAARRLEAAAARIERAVADLAAQATRIEQRAAQAATRTEPAGDIDIPGARDDDGHYARLLADLEGIALTARGADGNDGR
jgi:DNA polymerase III delta prime subunit